MQYARGLLNNAVSLARKAAQAEFEPHPARGDAQSSQQLTVTQQYQESARRPQPGGVTLTNPTVQSIDIRVQRFKHLLLASPVNVEQLGRLAFDGIPDKDNLRALTWKLLLGYLPPNPDEWNEVLARRRSQYHVFCNELILDPKALAGAEGVMPRAEQLAEHLAHPLQGQDVTTADHPLSCAGTSKWNEYFKEVPHTLGEGPISPRLSHLQDSEIMEQVVRDVVRTHPDMHFFSGDSNASEAHREVWLVEPRHAASMAMVQITVMEVKRALFMYAKLNPGLRYIQGMNELIAPLYYLFKNDTDSESAQYAEADAFWCFMELISDCRDHFCQQLDNAETGIRATIRRLMQGLQYHDRELWHHIEVVNKVDPQYYAFRWITLLLTQEFAFPDALRIWDMLLADPNGRMDCLLRVCTAMILTARERLMAGDFTIILKTLQRYPPIDVNVLLQRAAAMPPLKDVLGN